MQFWKIFIYIFLVALTINIVLALDKPIANFSDCYNISIEVNLLEGNYTPVSFIGCSQVDRDNFFCDCFTRENKNFSLIMQTDGGILRIPRSYELKVKEQFFNFKKRTESLPVDDWGDYVDTSSIDFDSLNAKPLPQIITKTETIYLNNTVYVDRPIDREVIKEVTKEINITQYIENTTKIQLCENNSFLLEQQLQNYTNKTQEYVSSTQKMKMNALIFGIVLCIVVLGIVIYSIIQEKRIKKLSNP